MIFGCAGLALSQAERAFFCRSDPLGFILFARNCADPVQVANLVRDLRASVGRADAPVLIDQEGGRVVRLGPPHWRAAPAAARFADLARGDPQGAAEAVRLNAQLIAAELVALGITVDCAPVLDVPQPDANDVIGDRAFGTDTETVALLGRAFADGLLAGGVLPVMKHLPGHGRATVDSHLALPVVEASADELKRIDFAPFRALNDLPWAMTAHVLYQALDPAQPATTSAAVIAGAIRGAIGFEGVLASDDISMRALAGGIGERTEVALAAGCDMVLHCNGDPAEMEAVAAKAGRLTEPTLVRLERARARVSPPRPFETAAAAARLEAMLAGAEVGVR